MIHNPSNGILKKVIFHPSDLNPGPSANFTYSPSFPTTSDVISFTDQSSDPDGVINSWYWDFDDGSDSTEQNPSHQYSDNGVYEVTLTVTNDQGENDSVTKSVEVGNTGPEADFSDDSPVVEEDNMMFTDVSTDPDGEIVYYEWDWENDGVYDLVGPDEDEVEHIYSENGTYAVRLRVTDDDGATDTYSREVEVINPWVKGSGEPNTSENNDFGVEARYGKTGDWEIAIKPTPNSDFFFWQVGQSYHFEVTYFKAENEVKFQVEDNVLGPAEVSGVANDNVAVVVRTVGGNDEGTTSTVRNISINGSTAEPEVTSTAPSGDEGEIRYIEFFDVDFSGDVVIEGDLIFDWQTSPELEGPAMVVDFT